LSRTQHQVRFTAEEWELVCEAAKKLYVPPATYVRRAGVMQALQELPREVVLELEDRCGPFTP